MYHPRGGHGVPDVAPHAIHRPKKESHLRVGATKIKTVACDLLEEINYIIQIFIIIGIRMRDDGSAKHDHMSEWRKERTETGMRESQTSIKEHVLISSNGNVDGDGAHNT